METTLTLLEAYDFVVPYFDQKLIGYYGKIKVFDEEAPRSVVFYWDEQTLIAKDINAHILFKFLNENKVTHLERGKQYSVNSSRYQIIGNHDVLSFMKE